MNRRDFFAFSGGLGAALLVLQMAFAQNRPGYQNLLILVELKGGNDGLNTVVPYTSQSYYQLRPRIGIKREEVLQLDQNVGFHPSLQPLMGLWQNKELAVIQGVGIRSRICRISVRLKSGTPHPTPTNTCKKAG